jgi:hypothetical protein
VRRRTTDVRDRDAAAYLLVCTTDRDGAACCGDADGAVCRGGTGEGPCRGDADGGPCRDDADGDTYRGDADGSAVAAAAREWLDERDALWTEVVPVESSCLALCTEDGAAVGVLPHDEWFSGVVPADVPPLLGGVFGPEAEQVEQ